MVDPNFSLVGPEGATARELAASLFPPYLDGHRISLVMNEEIAHLDYLMDSGAPAWTLHAQGAFRLQPSGGRAPC